MNKYILSSFLLFLTVLTASGQYTINAGNTSLEIGGLAAVYYNQRFLKEGETNLKKNRFELRNLRLNIEGRQGKDWEFKLNVDFAKLASNGVSGMALDPENPGLVDAWVSYNALPVKIKLGYDKVAYSQGSMCDVFGTPFWGRGILTDGTMFTRRDVGLTLSHSTWKQRLNIYGGVYSGLGENIFALGDNDASGNLEYIGRADVSFPSRYRYDEIDAVGVPIPMFRAGANIRYTNKTQPAGITIPAVLVDDYGLRFIDGKKTVYGFDASFMYRHFSAQFETHTLVMRPSSPTSKLYNNTSSDVNKGVVYAGGYLVQANYNWQKANSVFSVRYQSVDLNDLVYGNEEWVFFGYAYQFNGSRNCIKIHYYKPLKEDVKLDPLKWVGQIRVGWQYIF